MKKSKGHKVRDNRHKEDSEKMIASKTSWTPYIILIILSFVLYGNTIKHSYALDDLFVITENKFTQKGFGGIVDILTNDTFKGFLGEDKKMEITGKRYRPLSLVTFAIEYEFFRKSPHVSHFFNILLYCLTCILIYKLFLLLFKEQDKWFLSVPFITAVLFLAHPIHTEVVANIKGRDEILTLLFALISTILTFKYLENKNTKYLLYSFISFFLSLLSKENGITFLLIIPITVYFFRSYTIKQIALACIPLGIATLLFILIRQNIVGIQITEIKDNLMNNPFIYASSSQRYGTIIYTFGEYLKLLIFPHPLTWDYYPYHIQLIQITDFKVIFISILYAALFVFALLKIKSKNIFSYCIIFYLTTFSIVSNIVFPIGTFMGERFVFISSLGFILAFSYFLLKILPQWVKNKETYQYVLYCSIGLLMVGFSFKCISRNKAWKNDFTLYTTDVKTSSNSAKGLGAAGIFLNYEANITNDPQKRIEYYDLAMSYLKRSIEIDPQNPDIFMKLGNAYFQYKNDKINAINCYKRALKINALIEDAYTNLKIVIETLPIDQKIKEYTSIDSINSNRHDINFKLGTYYLNTSNNNKGIYYLEKAIKLDSTDTDSFRNLGVAYFNIGDYKKAVKFSEKASQLNPQNHAILQNVGLAYERLGEKEKAKQYFEKANGLPK